MNGYYWRDRGNWPLCYARAGSFWRRWVNSSLDCPSFAFLLVKQLMLYLC